MILLFERKLRNAMHGSILHTAVSTEEVHDPASSDGTIVSE